MKINLYALAQQQMGLDDMVFKNKQGIDRESTLPQRKVALLVELGELANELRFFKYWSNNQKPKDRKRVVDEFADVLHFTLSYVIDGYGWNKDVLKEELEAIEPLNYIDLTAQFTVIYYTITAGGANRSTMILRYVLGLAQLLDISEEEIVKIYADKHSINIERQNTGY